ncbi:sensor histidine kinase [Massilia rhizosphaerae]|uniref:sensor histidine kinase n=1 Tax=Massilia rhizosphaerae TaxID=2784389 RepID=UPI0018DD6F76|nr:ATP-binding protein [Massilia rhizosphaerae]
MASEVRAKAAALLAAAGLAALAFGAGRAGDAPRVLVLCGLGALAPALVLWRSLHALAAVRRPPAAEPRAVLNVEQQSLVDDALVLEARLEHAPVALFGIDGRDADGRVTPLNASARKLAAPGRSSAAVALYRQLAGQPHGDRTLLQFETERGTERALATVSLLTLHGRPQRLVALMPVESELEAAALDAWRQLVHVLTHEIMNSLTPVASLSRTARDLVEEARPALPADVAADLGTALDAIGRRADSLAAFVASYRSLSNVPAPRPERVPLAALFARLDALVGPDWRARGGAIEFSVEPASLELMADPGQLEQALINLLKNAFEATGAGGRARVLARLARGARLRIEVHDDGPGVPDALVAHIFTPFFTTRKQGGGIGLAMVRQLVHGNGGTVRYARPVSRGARFVITF